MAKSQTGFGARNKPEKFVKTVNPAWLETQGITAEEYEENESYEIAMQGGLAPPGAALNEHKQLRPQNYGLMLPDEGAWILIQSSPPTAYTVPVLSIFYAMPDPIETGRHPRYRVQINTPNGPLWLWPSEYTVVEDITFYLPYIGSDLEMHFLSDHAAVPADKLFYLRSRGISKADAYVMLLGEMHDPNFCYFVFGDAYRMMFGHPPLNPDFERQAREFYGTPEGQPLRILSRAD